MPALKWRKLRAQKVKKIDLPDLDAYRKDANKSPVEMMKKMQKEGISPPRQYLERNITISSTPSVFEAYVPPEGDGVASYISGKGAKQRFTGLEKKGKSYLQLRKIRKFEEDFDVKNFAAEALELYKEATKLLENIEENEDRLHELTTEKAYSDMTVNLEKRTFRWQYIQAIEPPRVVHVRTTELLSKENLYGQVTVRLHTKQTLAIYDRFGRLMYGGENLIKDVLEYVVFEKHLSDSLGSWRIHGKVIPDWMPAGEAVVKTAKKPAFDIQEDADEGEKKSEEKAATA